MWRTLWEQHRGACVGAAGGTLLGVIYLIFGFWDMLIFGFLVGVGVYLGAKADRKEPLFQFGEVWRRLSETWRMFR